MLNQAFLKDVVYVEDRGFVVIGQVEALSYSQYGAYTLVSWRQPGGGENPFTGQTLWRNFTPIASSGGALDLYSVGDVLEPGDPGYRRTIFDIRNHLTDNSRYELPKQVAMALLDPKNIVYLELS